jgi:hypothetical protein
MSAAVAAVQCGGEWWSLGCSLIVGRRKREVGLFWKKGPKNFGFLLASLDDWWLGLG